MNKLNNNYLLGKEESLDEIKKVIEKIKELSSQKNYDASLSLIEESLSEFPRQDEISSLKKTIKEEIEQKIEETKTNIKIANLNEALRDIKEYLSRSPKAFAKLENELQSIEKNLEKKFAKSKKAFEKGKGESALEILKELVTTTESEVVKSNFESINQMIKEIEGPPGEQAYPLPVKPVKKSETEKKLEEVTNKIEEKKFEEAIQILNEVIECEPENQEAVSLLKLMNADQAEVADLFWQNRFDDALLVLSIHLAKSPESPVLLSFKWRIESIIVQKIKAVNSAIERKDYKSALLETKEVITKNPKSFKELGQIKKQIEQYAKDKFSKAVEDYKSGDKENSLAILKELEDFNRDSIVEPSLDTIQAWIDKLEGKKKEKEVEVPEEKEIQEAELSSPDGVAILSGEEISPALKKTEKALRWIKSHPVLLAAGVVSLIILIIAAVLFLPSVSIKKEEPSSMGYILLVKKEGINYTGVSATIDSSSFPVNRQKAQEIQAGKHTLRFSQNTHSFEKEIYTEEGKTNEFHIPVIPLEINVNPKGEIWEADNLLRESNGSHLFFLLPSQYTFTIKQKGYKEETRDIVLEEKDEKVRLDINLDLAPSSLPGTLIVQLFPSGSIHEDDKLLASFPPFKQNIRLSPGAHALRFTTKEQECESITKTFQIGPNETETAIIYLCFGQLNINSMPPGATISVDGNDHDLSGKAYGKTPQANMKLPSGLHSITLRHPDYTPKTIQLVIEKNKTINKSLELTK